MTHAVVTVTARWPESDAQFQTLSNYINLHALPLHCITHCVYMCAAASAVDNVTNLKMSFFFLDAGCEECWQEIEPQVPQQISVGFLYRQLQFR